MGVDLYVNGVSIGRAHYYGCGYDMETITNTMAKLVTYSPKDLNEAEEMLTECREMMDQLLRMGRQDAINQLKEEGFKICKR